MVQLPPHQRQCNCYDDNKEMMLSFTLVCTECIRYDTFFVRHFMVVQRPTHSNAFADKFVFKYYDLLWLTIMSCHVELRRQ
jgi:hypothetical protein